MIRSRLLAATMCAVGLLMGSCARSSGQAAHATPKDIVLPMDGQSIDGKVPPNATLETLLRRQNLPPDTTGSLLEAVTGVFNPKDLRANQSYRITRTLDGIFREFRYQIDADRLLRVIEHLSKRGLA